MLEMSIFLMKIPTFVGILFILACLGFCGKCTIIEF